MTRSRPITLLAGGALLALTALGVAGCGSGGSANAASQAPKSAGANTAAGHGATLRVATTGLGKVLVDSRGHTLYLFKKDSGTTSACSGACATAWPPLRAGGTTTVGGGAKASLVGTTKRSDGTSQVTYNRHPLYTFIKDTKAGQTNGEGLTAFGAGWFAVSAAGKQVSSRPSKSASGSASSRAPAATATPAPKAAPRPTPRPAPTSTPAPKKSPAASNGIPQNNGGDQDSDNNGGPSDGDGGV
jgi:predicted lipoprotein with Yx(FWY)xxD motif